MKDQSFLRRISIILFVVMLVMFIVHVQILVHFNQQVITVHGNDSTGSAYMEINDRENSTSSWLKREFLMTDGRKVNLIGQTIDETLYNNSGDVIQEWGLRIDITGDCFINQAWNGEVEVHQFTGSEKEKVQRLNLQDYNLGDVQLQYRYDGDLLIPMQKGDYVVYYPSEDRRKDCHSRHPALATMLFCIVRFIITVSETVLNTPGAGKSRENSPFMRGVPKKQDEAAETRQV